MRRVELVWSGCGIDWLHGRRENGTCSQCELTPGQWLPDLALLRWKFSLQNSDPKWLHGYVRLLATREDGGQTYGGWASQEEEPRINADQIISGLRGTFCGRDTVHYCAHGESTPMHIEIERGAR